MAWYKTDAGAFASDVTGLSLRYAGAYANLRNLYWMNGNRFPDDEAKIMRRIGATTEEDIEAARTILDEFFPIGQDGIRHHDYLDIQVEDVMKESLAKKAAAESRWKKPRREDEDF